MGYTHEELMVEYFEDLIELDPNQAFSPTALEEGRIVHVTGDDVADGWERQIAEGKTPDLTSSIVNAEDKQTMARWLKPKAKATPVETPVELPDVEEEFTDDYTKDPA